jgi:hypothetical protein
MLGVVPLTATETRVGAADAEGVGVAGVDEPPHAHPNVAKLVAVKRAAIQRLIVPSCVVVNDDVSSRLSKHVERDRLRLVIATAVADGRDLNHRRPDE